MEVNTVEKNKDYGIFQPDEFMRLKNFSFSSIKTTSETNKNKLTTNISLAATR